jgi:ankyrin repeat protein
MQSHLPMNPKLKLILAQVADTADFWNVDLSDVNACAPDGDNALHVIVRWGDLAAAQVLIDAGIDISKAGDLGYTPLHVACMEGNIEMVKILAVHGADLFALSEGDPPFASARLAGHDNVCDFLAPLMQQVQSQDPQIWMKARIAQLKREIEYLESQLNRF